MILEYIIAEIYGAEEKTFVDCSNFLFRAFARKLSSGSSRFVNGGVELKLRSLGTTSLHNSRVLGPRI